MPGAVRIHSYGPPEVLRWESVVLPPLQPGEIRIRTLAAAVNRADLEIRSGKWPIRKPDPFPYTPGLEVVGEVSERAPDVSEPPAGAHVITMMQRLGGIHGVRPGGYQEFVTVEAAKVTQIPGPHDPRAVAALGLAAVTALHGLDALRLKEFERVVIHGATGGVGSVAVSLAKLLGARVIATTSSAGKKRYLESLGADEVVVFGRTNPGSVLPPRSVDAVLETLGTATFAASVSALKPGGRLALVGAASGPELTLSAWDLIQSLHLTGWSSENLTPAGLRGAVDRLCGWLEDGELPPPPYEIFPFAQAAEVHARIEAGGFKGRALLVPA